MRRKIKIVIAVVVGMGCILVLVCVGLWGTHSDTDLMMFTAHRPPIMGTQQFNLTAVVRPGQANHVEGIFHQAETAARTVDTLMSVYNPASELSRFNAAPAGQTMPLSRQTIDVLTRSFIIWKRTDGAFDVTISPLIQLWKRCEKADRVPSESELHRARNESLWSFIDIRHAGAIKTMDSAAVDLGGIAKGYAIDLAVEVMISAGCAGGIVDIGGDVRCFGQKPDKKPWRVAIVDPFDDNSTSPFAILAVRNAAVCTSGNYRRYHIIKQKRYSHIIDPRTGMPAEMYPSVTVVAPDACTADAWATGLSILGPEGLKLLAGTDIEAMVVIGSPENFTWQATSGFRKLMTHAPPRSSP